MSQQPARNATDSQIAKMAADIERLKHRAFESPVASNLLEIGRDLLALLRAQRVRVHELDAELRMQVHMQNAATSMLADERADRGKERRRLRAAVGAEDSDQALDDGMLRMLERQLKLATVPS
jgi:hypothetical protein